MEFLPRVVLNFGFLKKNVITNVIWIHFLKKMKLRMLKTLIHVAWFQKVISYNTVSILTVR